MKVLCLLMTAMMLIAISSSANNECAPSLVDVTIEDARSNFHGPNYRQPSPESALGKYIAETGAATVLRTFENPETHAQSPEKLVVAVSELSFAKFMEFIGSKENYILHVHTPEQGTLYVAHEGKEGSYGKLNSTMAAPTEGTIMPAIVLDSVEAKNARNFFKLAELDENAAQYPWDLKDAQSKRYCALGGYTSCTHWFGNIPIGREKVNAYTLPGFVDRYASNHLDGVTPDSPQDQAPRIQDLTPYEYSGAHADLVRQVWQVPGHKQLSDVLGQIDANGRGEFANPGWVAISLFMTTTDRVPVVFLMTADHRAPIPADFNTRVSPK